ncbi:MAG: DNA topoisomerase 3 [Paramuribaculum sp.]|nr:DNA topoisomerase 3 [Paramuribaculum sp.]
MKLCITEKPSVAKDIATILGGANAPRRDGYFDCGEYLVTWTYGHLCTLKEPADYTDMWKRWSLGSLPMIPERFGIKLIDDAGYKRQFGVIETLIKNADEVINCGDAGQEGELIQRWVMQKAGVKCPVYRLWISSLTDEAIREGFSHLRPQADFDNLYLAGLSRAIGDWILGMNATRLYSLKYSEPGKVLSIGRVQTPTLALIVKRQREIDHFKPKDYWELRTEYRETMFGATSGKFDSAEAAEEAAAAITNIPLRITDVQQKKGREAPPRLFDLTSLQVECNKRWGWSADETLKLIQTLYEKKVTTYPRVDTTYLSEDIYPKVPGILRKLTPYSSVTAPVLEGKIPKSKKVFDNSKVTDHHAIIPTGQAPNTLVGNERKLYHIIVLRFIAAFYPDCIFQSTTVMAQAGETAFKVTGKVITDPGWRSVYAAMDSKAKEQEDQNQDSTDRVLPPFTPGEQGPHKPSVVKKTTQPPKAYTEGTLLRAMESAGKTVDDEELREAMKENGIGRPSTRAAIIETLFKRGYIRRERKSIAACDAGMELVDTIREEMLKSAALTGVWENKLRRIERGEYSPGEFVDELKGQISEIVQTVLSDNSNRRIHIEGESGPEKKSAAKVERKGKEASAEKPKAKRSPAVRKLEAIVCPECGQGHILKGRSAYGCSRYREGCGLRLPFEQYSAELTPGKLNTAIKKNYKKHG